MSATWRFRDFWSLKTSLVVHIMFTAIFKIHYIKFEWSPWGSMAHLAVKLGIICWVNQNSISWYFQNLDVNLGWTEITCQLYDSLFNFSEFRSFHFRFHMSVLYMACTVKAKQERDSAQKNDWYLNTCTFVSLASSCNCWWCRATWELIWPSRAEMSPSFAFKSDSACSLSFIVDWSSSSDLCRAFLRSTIWASDDAIWSFKAFVWRILSSAFSLRAAFSLSAKFGSSACIQLGDLRKAHWHQLACPMIAFYGLFLLST